MSRDNKDPTEDLSRDMARKIASYLDRNSFFAFSSVNRKLRKFFFLEREIAINTPRIRVKKTQACSFLQTRQGQLYACGNVLDSKNPYKDTLQQWTRIGPAGERIVEFAFSEKGYHLFVQCEDAWYHLGKSLSEWRPIFGPNRKSIVKLIATERNIFILCKDEVWYESECNFEAPLNWKRLGRPWKKILELQILEERQFLRDQDGWYARGQNKNGELGLGHHSEWENWIKLGPENKSVLQVKADHLNTVVYCSDGKWYGCGQNQSGQLGEGIDAVQAHWVPVGPKDKLIYSMFLGGDKTFAAGADGLYACGDTRGGFGLDLYTQKQPWVYVGFANKEINEMLIRANATFVRCEDGWYACGDNCEGVLGAGDERSHEEWEKFDCEGQEILKIVPSDEYTFVACKEAWYFAGNGHHGQNGLADDIGKRTRWIKVLPHGESVESRLARLAQEKEEKKKEPPSIKFRRALEKLYDRRIVEWLQNSAYEFPNEDLRICYHPSYPENHIYFLISSEGMGMIDGFQEDEFNARIKEILETSSFDLVHEPSPHPIFQGWRQFYSIGWTRECAKPSMIAVVSLDNYEGLCQFLRDYEAILDAQDSLEQEAAHAQRGPQ